MLLIAKWFTMTYPPKRHSLFPRPTIQKLATSFHAKPIFVSSRMWTALLCGYIRTKAFDKGGGKQTGLYEKSSVIPEEWSGLSWMTNENPRKSHLKQGKQWKAAPTEAYSTWAVLVRIPTGLLLGWMSDNIHEPQKPSNNEKSNEGGEATKSTFWFPKQ